VPELGSVRVRDLVMIYLQHVTTAWRCHPA
jgi:hypothetical protein